MDSVQSSAGIQPRTRDSRVATWLHRILASIAATTLVAGCLILMTPGTVAAASGVELKASDPKIDQPGKLELKDTKPKTIKLNKQKPKQLKPKATKPKKLKPQIGKSKKPAKPQSGSVRKLKTKPQVKKAPGATKPNTGKPAPDLDAVPGKNLTRRSRNAASVGDDAQLTKPVPRLKPGSSQRTAPGDLRIEPGRALSKKLVAPDIKELAIRPAGNKQNVVIQTDTFPRDEALGGKEGITIQTDTFPRGGKDDVLIQTDTFPRDEALGGKEGIAIQTDTFPRGGKDDVVIQTDTFPRREAPGGKDGVVIQTDTFPRDEAAGNAGIATQGVDASTENGVRGLQAEPKKIDIVEDSVKDVSGGND